MKNGAAFPMRATTHIKLSRSVHRWSKTVAKVPRQYAIAGMTAVLIAFSFLSYNSKPQYLDLSAYGGNLLRPRLGLESQYSHVLVKDCLSRLAVGGVTTRTEVRGAGVSYISWSPNQRTSLRRLRTYPPVQIMKKFKRPAVLLDVGANIGKIAFPTMSLYEPHTVIAVEPVRTNVDRLCMTANLNGWLKHPGLVLVEAAMSDSDSSVKIYVPDGREDNSALSSTASIANVHVSQHVEKIQTIAGDKFLEVSDFHPDVIKIDTQGHELHVLRGLRKYLAKAERTLVIAESDPKLMKKSGIDPKDIYKLMVTDLGYTPYYSVNATVVDDVLRVSGEEIPEDVYPTRTVRDILYFKSE